MEDIQLAPPNLKVWAERRNRIQLGLTEREARDHLIGNEGAGLNDDEFIAVYTSWLGPDGAPLPEELGDYGYTARLAKVDLSGSLVDTSFTEHFSVKPGIKMQLLQLPEKVSLQHYYVQINAKQHDVSFKNVGANGAMLNRRPDKFVPFMVPLYDEELSNLAQQAAADSGGEEVQPIYQWVYRPEFQFSIYEMLAWELNRTDAEGQVTDILDLENPTLQDGDTLLSLYYDLTTSENPMPDAYSYDGERELVFSLGGEEVTATLGYGETVEFESFSQLAELSQDDVLTLSLYTNNDSANILWEYTFGPLPSLLVDFNRNGSISVGEEDLVSADKPYLFWVNDDDDNGEVAQLNSDVPGAEPWTGESVYPSEIRSPDYAQDRVGFSSDLVDYFAVGLDIKSTLNAYPPSAGYSYILRQEDSAFNFIYSDLTFETSGDYLTEFMSTGFGPTMNESPDMASKQKVTTSGEVLSSGFLNRITATGEGVLLMDVRKPTDKPLELVVKKDNTELSVLQLPIETSGVEDMFRHVNLADVVVDQNGETVRDVDADSASRTGVPANYPDGYSNGKYFVFVHGYNVSQESARGWHAETFKRLHQLGSNARFVGVTWHGDTGIDYHEAVKYAFITGMKLKEELSFVTGDVTIAAHSLGNMVVSSAIAEGDFRPTRYYMINAAVPIEAYSSAQSHANGGQEKMIDRMTEDSWKDYRQMSDSDKLFADGWHTLFTDARSALTWADRFRGVFNVPTYNFYSSGEDVVENPYDSESVNSALWDKIITGLSFGNIGRHAWVAQEITKGSDSTVMNGLFGNLYAGWGYNYAHAKLSGDPPAYTVLSSAEAIQLSKDTLRNEPFFNRFEQEDNIFNFNGDNLYGPDQDATANTEADKAGTQYKLLAEAIPARSYAAAANQIDKLQVWSKNNFNMMGMKNQEDEWPDVRPKKSGTTQGEWWHSDFRAVALIHTHPVWRKMIEVGGLAQ